MRKTILLMIMSFLIMPIVLAADYNFKQNTVVDLKIPCFTNDNAFCNSVTNCTITINKPDGTNIIYKNMSYNPSFFNYTLNITDTSTLGVHDAIMQCNSNLSSDNDGYSRFNFEITKWGDDAADKQNNITFFLVGFALLFFIFLIVVGLFKSDKIWIKTCLALSLSFVIMITIRMLGWFIEIVTPHQAPLIDFMSRLYQWGVWGFRVSLIFSLFVLIIILINSMRMEQRKKKDNWDRWGLD